MTLDFSPLYRSAVGFDRLMSMIDAAQKGSGPDTYPPYNIEKTGNDSYQVTLAVAGFAPEDLDVEVRDGQLVIVGKSAKANRSGNFLHQGIGRRAFERRFQLADHVEVKGADLRDGLLTIDLEREIPEALKPKKIAVRSGSANMIDGQAKQAA